MTAIAWSDVADHFSAGEYPTGVRKDPRRRHMRQLLLKHSTPPPQQMRRNRERGTKKGWVQTLGRLSACETGGHSLCATAMWHSQLVPIAVTPSEKIF